MFSFFVVVAAKEVSVYVIPERNVKCKEMGGFSRFLLLVKRVPTGEAGGAEGEHRRLQGREAEAGENLSEQQEKYPGKQNIVTAAVYLLLFSNISFCILKYYFVIESVF